MYEHEDKLLKNKLKPAVLWSRHMYYILLKHAQYFLQLLQSENLPVTIINYGF